MTGPPLTRPIRVVVILGVAVALSYLFACDVTSPNVHPAPLVEHDSTTVERL
jgi:hypothetical protein